MDGRIVLLDWTANGVAELGLDMMHYGAQECRGWSGVPAGPHLLRAGPALAPQLEWMWVAGGDAQTHSFRWNARDECLVRAANSPPPAADAVLARYGQNDGSWAEATCHMDESVVRLERGALLPPALKRRRVPSYDRSDELDELLRAPVNVLGLLQRCFLEFSLAHDMDAFDCWRAMVLLLCHCVRALRARQALFGAFATMLAWQFRQAGEELLWEPTNNVFLQSVRVFARDVLGGDADHGDGGGDDDDDVLSAPLKQAARDLATALGIDDAMLEDDPDDMPTIVGGDLDN